MLRYELDLRGAGRETMRGHLRLGGENPQGERIALNSFFLERSGVPWIPVMGEFHYARYPSQYWEEELLKMKACGIDIVASYVFWIHHEEEEGVFDWSGERDLRRFIQLCGKHDLLAFIRIGPFCHGEARNGGLPDWLYGRPFEVRSNDERYLSYVRRFYQEIGHQVRGLLYRDGGPVIGVQLENEFMASEAPWETTYRLGEDSVPKGTGGEEHIRRLKEMAIEAGIMVPIYSCTAWDSPILQDETLPMQGGYAFFAWEDGSIPQEPSNNYVFRDLHRDSSRTNYDTSRYPVSCCEMGGGMLVYDLNRPVVPPESVEAMSVTKLGSGVNFIGYYVFHGGSNPAGKHSYLHEYRVTRVSYDYQAPIREFGQIAPSYRMLKRLFLFLHQYGERLATMHSVIPENQVNLSPRNSEILRYAARTDGRRGFLFLNNYQDHVEMPKRDGVQIQMQLSDEEIRIPMGKGFTLLKDQSAILPFNLDLGTGILIKYATVQPLTEMKAGGESFFFFFAPKGIESEIGIDTASVATVTVREGDRVLPVESGNAVFRIKPGLEPAITITSHTGKRSHLVILTDEQSLSFWKGLLWGEERAVISDADLIFDQNRLIMRKIGDTAMRISFFPQPVSLRKTGDLLHPVEQSLFSTYDVIAEPKRPSVEREILSDWKMVLRFPQDAFESVSDLFLRIDYEGDWGGAYINGRLVSDHLWNGTTWEIGLKRFRMEIEGGELVLQVYGRKKEGYRADTTDMAAYRLDGAKTAKILTVEVVPEYEVILGQ